MRQLRIRADGPLVSQRLRAQVRRDKPTPGRLDVTSGSTRWAYVNSESDAMLPRGSRGKIRCHSIAYAHTAGRGFRVVVVVVRVCVTRGLVGGSERKTAQIAGYV